MPYGQKKGSFQEKMSLLSQNLRQHVIGIYQVGLLVIFR